MNIYIISPWYPKREGDLDGSFVHEQAHALAEREHHVTVFCIEPISVTQLGKKPWHTKRVWQDGNVRTIFHEVIIPFPAKFGRVQDKYIADVFTKILQKQIAEDQAHGLGKPDLIHAHVSHSCAYYCVQAAKKLLLPIVTTEHYSGLALGKASEKEYARVHKTIEQSDAFIFVGSRFREFVCDKFGITKQTYVVRNMLDVSKYHLGEKKEDTFTFLTACYLKKHKCVDLVIRAFHQAFDPQEPVRLVIAGAGVESDNLKRLAAECGETQRIEFFGRYSREQAGELFANADAFVLTSQSEPFGIVYVEALASGVPCIGTAGQGADDIIDDSNGFRVTHGDINELAARMHELYQHRERYDAVTIREACIARFDKDTICQEIENIYAIALNKTRDK